MGQENIFTDDTYTHVINSLLEIQKDKLSGYFEPLAETSKLTWLGKGLWGFFIEPLLGILFFGAILQFYPLNNWLVTITLGAETLISGFLGLWSSIGGSKRGLKQTLIAALILSTVSFWEPVTRTYSIIQDYNAEKQKILLFVAFWLILFLSWLLNKLFGKALREFYWFGYPLSKSIGSLVGTFSPELVQKSYKTLLQEIDTNEDNWEDELDYVIATSQARLDSAEVRALPWGLPLAIISLGIVDNLPDLIKTTIWTFVIIVVLSMIANTAHFASLHDAILQAAARIKHQKQPTQLD